MRRFAHLLLLSVLVAACAGFQLLAAATPARAWGEIPAQAWRYKELVRRAALSEHGPGAPVALYAAQLAQESGWNPQARSVVGALGLAQFMPGTARDVGRQRPDMGPPLPTNPEWAVRALVYYDLQQKRRITAATEFDQWAFALCAYNGGLGNVYKDQARARAQGLDPGRVEHVDRVNAGRSKAAKAENVGYWSAIMLRRMPVYEASGFGQGVRR